MAENIDSFIVDASFVLSFLLPDEQNSGADQIFERFHKGEVQLLAPLILPFEVFNGLTSTLLSKRLTQSKTENLVKRFLDLQIPLAEIDPLETFGLTVKNKLTFYDAAYLYLAKVKQLPLLSLDERLKNLI